MSDEENANDDEDEMLFVRGASPMRKGAHENSSPKHGDHDNFNSGSDFEERANRHRDEKRGGARCNYDLDLLFFILSSLHILKTIYANKNAYLYESIFCFEDLSISYHFIYTLSACIL